MKRHLPGLNGASPTGDEILEGLFLVRVEGAAHRWHPQKPFLALRLVVLEPKVDAGKLISGRLYCTPRALWKLNWFLRDFGYDPDLLGREEIDEPALLNLRGVVRVSHTTLNGRCYLNLDGFAPAGEWEELSPVLESSQKDQAIEHDL